LLGLIPVGWFPGAIVHDAHRNELYVANIKGSLPGKHYAPGEHVKYRSHQYFGTLSLLPVPSKAELASDTAVGFRNYRRAIAEQVFLSARPATPPRPVPETHWRTVGLQARRLPHQREPEPTTRSLATSRKATAIPASASLATRRRPINIKWSGILFLLDNTYCSGILSADGHEWADTAFATDYMEKSFAGFPRSYPDGMEEHDIDALAYAPTGFIWDDALAHGKTLRDYGEFTLGFSGWKDPSGKKEAGFLDFYNDFIGQTGFDEHRLCARHRIPPAIYHDQHHRLGPLRSRRFSRRAVHQRNFINLRLREKNARPHHHLPAERPTLPGPRRAFPRPPRRLRIMISRLGASLKLSATAPFWKDTCIFAIEDDPQDGWDHVSGYRTTAYVISPYTKRHAVVSANYNHTSLLRTVELILGLPPMNQMDATATPMFECFTSRPDFTPFDSVPNNVPLDQLNPAPAAIKDPHQRRDGRRLLAPAPRQTRPMSRRPPEPHPLARAKRAKCTLPRVGRVFKG